MSLPQVPQSPESEIAVLSSILMDPRRCLDLCHQNRLSRDSFYGRTNSMLYGHLLSMDSEGLPIDATTLTMRLKDAGQLEEVGGFHGITQIAMGVPTSAQIEHFLGVLKEKAQARKIIEVCTLAIQRANASEDPLPQLEQGIFSIGMNSQTTDNELQATVERFFKELDRKDQGLKDEAAITVSLNCWKRAFGGLIAGRYYAIGGRPGAGKSALAEQFTLEALAQDKRVMFVSKEMGTDRILRRLLSKMASVNHSKYVRDFSTEEDRKKLRYAASQILKKNIFLCNPSMLTGAGLRSMMRREHRKQKLDLVVIDYMQKLDLEGSERFLGVGQNSIQISNAINETGIPALVVVQLNRSSEHDTRRPRMSDLAESSQIERDADCIAMLWKDGEDAPDSRDLPRIFSITKNRDGASDFDEKLWLHGPTMTLTDRI